jgi:16S rRNA (cytosine967-C5)-methyltransferase
MNPGVRGLIERVILKSDRAHPVDALLRQELKDHGGLSRVDASVASRLVFTYFRWRGWLDDGQPLQEQLHHASTLDNNFRNDPESISDGELIDKAVPAWVRNEVEVTAAWARVLQTQPVLWLRARPGQGKLLAKRLHHCRALGDGPLSDTLSYHGREDLFRTPEFHEGAFELQDASSQAVGLLCAPEPGQTWWDACAGEGGKLLHLSDLMQNRGLVWATDRAEWRLRKLKRRTARAKVFNYRSAIWDGGAKLPTRTKFDGILVDAPCSGIGTWQRNPHARWTLEANDISELAALQVRLLNHVAPALKPGGKLLYSVCSIARAETHGVLTAFDANAHGLSPMPLKNPFIANSSAETAVWLLPEQAGGNGMYVAGWIRK